jgi:hypothetical protein
LIASKLRGGILYKDAGTIFLEKKKREFGRRRAVVSVFSNMTIISLATS